MSAPAKITYTSASGDLEEFHHRFATALAGVKEQAGRQHPLVAPANADARLALEKAVFEIVALDLGVASPRRTAQGDSGAGDAP